MENNDDDKKSTGERYRFEVNQMGTEKDFPEDNRPGYDELKDYFNGIYCCAFLEPKQINGTDIPIILIRAEQQPEVLGTEEAKPEEDNFGQVSIENAARCYLEMIVKIFHGDCDENVLRQLLHGTILAKEIASDNGTVIYLTAKHFDEDLAAARSESNQKGGVKNDIEGFGKKPVLAGRTSKKGH